MNINSVTPVVALMLGSVFFLESSPAHAGPFVPQVELTHRFNTRIIGNQDYRVTWDRADRALARDTAGTVTDTFAPAILGPLAPPVGGTTAPRATATSPLGSAKADMVSSFQANADGTGFAKVKGMARITANTGLLATSEGFSTVGLNRGVTDRQGNVRWSPEWKFHTARTGRLGDPIDFTFIDLDDGTSLSSTLFDLDMDFSDGGDSTYLNGDLFISGAEGSFSLIMDSPYITTGVGTIEIAFSGGLITSSSSSGIFSSLGIPSVGSNSMGFGFHLGDETGAFDIGFDFGTEAEEDNVLGYDFQGLLGGDAYIEADEVQPLPEPATWLLIASGGAFLFARRRQNPKQPLRIRA